MIGRAARLAAVFLAGLALVAACDSSNRPEDLSLSGVKPCQLILQSKLKALEVTRGPTLVDDTGGVGLEGASCWYSVVYGRPAKHPSAQVVDNRVKMTVVTNHGVGWQIDDVSDGDSFEYKDVRRIQGYRAVRVWDAAHPPGRNTYCELYVDVANEQMLKVHVGSSSGEVDPPTCDTARRFAKAALKTLRAWQG